MPDNHLPVQPQPRMHEPRLPIPMRCLIEIHEIHVNLRPRQIAIELRMQVRKWFMQVDQAADPHFGGGEGVHPEDEASALGIV